MREGELQSFYSILIPSQWGYSNISFCFHVLDGIIYEKMLPPLAFDFSGEFV